jgi:Circularly permutated YpsA SLOG family
MSGSETLKVISGGQTGADIAALRAARLCGLPTGGVAPADYITSAGPNLELGTEFGLQQLIRQKESLSQMYVRRSTMNVDQSQATIAFRLKPSVGTDKTIGYCQYKKWNNFRRCPPTAAYRPHIIIEDVEDEEAAAELVVAFLREHNVAVVNVCGHRDDATACISGFEARVERILTTAFRAVQKQRDSAAALPPCSAICN